MESKPAKHGREAANAGIEAVQRKRRDDAAVQFNTALEHFEAIEDDAERRKELGTFALLLYHMGFPDLALMAAQEKLQRDYYELQSMYMTLQQELAEQEARTLEKMYTNCQALAKDLAKDFSLDLVLIRDQSTILFVAGGVDLTDELIKRYNKKYK